MIIIKKYFLKNIKIYYFIITLNLNLELYQNLHLKFHIIFPLIQIKKLKKLIGYQEVYLLIRKKYIIKNKYFNFEGKAYCEDLIHSNLLKNNGIKLFISNKSFYKTEHTKP